MVLTDNESLRARITELERQVAMHKARANRAEKERDELAGDLRSCKTWRNELITALEPVPLLLSELRTATAPSDMEEGDTLFNVVDYYGFDEMEKAVSSALRQSPKLRNDSTPEGRKIWDAVDRAAERAPSEIKKIVETFERGEVTRCPDDITTLKQRNACLVAVIGEPMTSSTCINHDDPGCWWCEAEEGTDHKDTCRANAALKENGEVTDGD